MKKACLILVILILAVIGQGQSGLAESSEVEARPGYQTLRGQIHDIGTGEAPILVFKTAAGSYLISNARADSNQGEDAGADNRVGASVDARKLSSLKGLPLLLTGRVNLLDGGSFLGQITVEDYNTYYDGPSKNSWEEVAILGRLVDGGDNLVLLTRDQLVVQLAPDSYHSLDKYIQEEVVITGSLEKFDDYSGQMEVKSYKVLPGD